MLMLMLMNHTGDAMRLQKAIPHGEKATQAGERVGQEGMANIDEAVRNRTPNQQTNQQNRSNANNKQNKR